MQDEHDTSTTDLLRTVTTELESDKAGRAEFTIAGFGTGTVAEIEAHLAQITDERDSARRALADLANSPGTELVALISGIAERVALRVAESVAFSDSEIDGDAIWDEIEYRVTDAAETAASEAAGEIDGNAIWAEIEDRVADTAAESARSVIRDDLVVTVDLI